MFGDEGAKSAVEPRVESVAECDPERAEILDVIQQEIDRLPDHYRATIVLCDLQGLSRDEAAALLGCPAGTVGGRLARGRRQLRDQLQRRGVAPLVVFPFRPSCSRGRRLAKLRSKQRLARRRHSPRGTRRRPRLSCSRRCLPGPGSCPGQAGDRPDAHRLPRSRPYSGTTRTAEPPDLPANSTAGRGQPALDSPPRFRFRSTPTTRNSPADSSDASSGPMADRWRAARLFIVPDSSSAVTLGPVRTLSGADGRFEFDAPDMTYSASDGLPARQPGLLVALADGVCTRRNLHLGTDRSHVPLAP